MFNPSTPWLPSLAFRAIYLRSAFICIIFYSIFLVTVLTQFSFLMQFWINLRDSVSMKKIQPPLNWITHHRFASSSIQLFWSYDWGTRSMMIMSSSFPLNPLFRRMLHS